MISVSAWHLRLLLASLALQPGYWFAAELMATQPRAGLAANGEPRPTKFLPGTLSDVTGHVTVVSNKAITVRVGPDKQFLTFAFHDALAAGRIHELAMFWNGYRAADVKVGDVVTLALHDEGRQVLCAEISIRKRPGTRVPESFKTGEPAPSYATRQNAANDLADFGIPLPKNCRPATSDADFYDELKRMGEETARQLQELRHQEEEKKAPPPNNRQ